MQATEPIASAGRAPALSSFWRVVRGLFGCLTTRGRWFMAIGAAAVICGLNISQPDLVRVGALLAVSPLVTALSVLRSRGRLSCVRRLHPRRVAAQEPTEVTVRVENASRLRSEALVAEDVIPDPVGAAPRFALDEIEPNGNRELTYQIRPHTRGEFAIGPLRARIADPFGLVEVGWAFGATSTLVVTPRIVPLPPTAAARTRPGEGGDGIRAISGSGEDDAAPRQYRDGDGMHRVHWKSTARYGELMVRREEPELRTSASTVFLDARRSSHAGTGPASTFEFAVSAAASIGTHLTGDGSRARLVTDAGETAPDGASSDTLLDRLALITPSRTADLRTGMSALAEAGGPLIAVAGRLSDDDAVALAAARRGNAPAMALLLDVSGWTTDDIAEDTAHTAEILSAAGWHVAVASASTSLAAAWQQLHRPVSPIGPLEPAGRTPGVR
jgi:uncharacterized protein (DUF58 family)